VKALLIPSALLAAAVAPLWAAPAQAEQLPSEPAHVHLKGHEAIPLAWTDTGLRLTADHDAWTFQPVEALVDLGAYLIRHEDTGQCLTADTSGGEETVPVTLVDCADAIAWEVVFNDLPSHEDFRFVAPDGHFLGLESGSDAVEGTEVMAVLETNGSKHFQEWRLAVVAPTPPQSESQSPSLSAEAPASPAAAAPQLPSTGTGLGAAVGAGIVALAGGAALIVWWQRRRALRTHW
jgi:LPXTG-motif cell wall-anchored protein